MYYTLYGRYIVLYIIWSLYCIIHYNNILQSRPINRYTINRYAFRFFGKFSKNCQLKTLLNWEKF